MESHAILHCPKAASLQGSFGFLRVPMQSIAAVAFDVRCSNFDFSRSSLALSCWRSLRFAHFCRCGLSFFAKTALMTKSIETMGIRYS